MIGSVPADPAVSPRGRQTLATILRHDNKTTTYKIALVRAINDVVLAFPESLDLVKETDGDAVAIPLRMLAAGISTP